MKLEEKIEKGLKKTISDWRPDDETTTLAWKTGFRTGFRRGYDLACEEAAGEFKEIQKEIEKIRMKAENIIQKL